MAKAIDHHPARRGQSILTMLQWSGLVTIAAIATLRCVIVFAPQVMFDVDPYSNPTPLGGLGPGGSMLLDVLLLVGCLLALIGQWRYEGKVAWLPFALALAPTPAIFWHGMSDAGDFWRGSTWSAAAIAGVTVAHLAGDRMMRLILIGILVSIIAPLLLRGANQMTFEHAAMLEVYDQTRDQFLAERGWEHDSSAARIYERRLRQPEPLGWFATTNIFAAFAGFGMVVCLGFTLTSHRAGLQSGWTGLMGLCALASACALWMTGSRGAQGAAVMGIAAGVVLNLGIAVVDRLAARGASPAIRSRKAINARIQSGVVVYGLIAFALLAVIVHGTMLPEKLRNLSLLFRWHYFFASARIFLDQPWLGVGPDGFQQAYTLHRVPRNPEEVSSAHSVFIDWLTMLGVFGSAWIVLVLLWLRRATSALDASTADAKGPETLDGDSKQLAKRCAIAVALLAFIPALLIELPVSDLRTLLIRGLSAGVFIALAIVIVHVIDRSSARNIQAWLVAGITAILVHAQIEMTFYQPGAIVWLMCTLGVTGHARLIVGKRNAIGLLIIGLMIFVQALLTLVLGAWPALLQERQVLHAAGELVRAREHQANAELVVRARQTAASALVDAYEIWPANVKPLEAAVAQLGLAGARSAGADSLESATLAAKFADRAVAEHGKPSSLALAVTSHVQAAMMTGQAHHWQAAVQYAQQMTELDPHGINSWKRLGDVLWLADARTAAATAYDRALENNDRLKLDPLKQLSDRTREELQRRVEAAGLEGKSAE